MSRFRVKFLSLLGLSLHVGGLVAIVSTPSVYAENSCAQVVSTQLPISQTGLDENQTRLARYLVRTADWLRDPDLEIFNFHLRKNGDDDYQVLEISGDGTITVGHYGSENTARARLRKLPYLLNYAAILKGAAEIQSEVEDRFKKFAEGPIQWDRVRPKSKKGFKDKLFDKPGSLLSAYDDLGARLVTTDLFTSLKLASDLKRAMVNGSLGSGASISPWNRSNGSTWKMEAIARNQGAGYLDVTLTHQTPAGIRIEIQIVTQLMKMWHQWDHDVVYKNPELASRAHPYRDSLRSTSKTLALLINILDLNEYRQFRSQWVLENKSPLPRFEDIFDLNLTALAPIAWRGSESPARGMDSLAPSEPHWHVLLEKLPTDFSDLDPNHRPPNALIETIASRISNNLARQSHRPSTGLTDSAAEPVTPTSSPVQPSVVEPLPRALPAFPPPLPYYSNPTEERNRSHSYSLIQTERLVSP